VQTSARRGRLSGLISVVGSKGRRADRLGTTTARKTVKECCGIIFCGGLHEEAKR
jgi:hypothetical protein